MGERVQNDPGGEPMTRKDTAAFLHARMKAVYGYCLRRCASHQDAEDTAQEILLRTHAALIRRTDVTDPERYLWTVARNTLANLYRDRARCTVGVPVEAVDETDFQSALLEQEETRRLHGELARLSRQQREIVVMHYFRGMKQSAIAQALGIPVGTVKWHLHEAKKELKQHMNTPRPTQHLKFDPIRFSGFAVEGSSGSEGSPWRIFRSALHQNIVYAAWHKARTAGEIADALGVSPVYITDELDYLTEHGYLTCEGGRYRCAILLTEADDRLTDLADRMHQDAAELIAPALHRALSEADFWSEPGIHTGAEPTDSPDHSYALWALIPWCIAGSAAEQAIPFSSVATLRPDGACNLLHATISAPGARMPALFEQMDSHFSGPCWNEMSGMTLWQMDTCWSSRRIGEIYQHEAKTTLTRLRHFFDDASLTREEYAAMAEQGLLRCEGDPDGLFHATLLPVWVSGKALRERLQRLCREVYARHSSALDTLKAPYAEALLSATPPHLHRARLYTLQNVYQSGWFILHCLQHLTQTGLLRLPTEAEKRSLHTVIFTG
ncbi:MAG: RNA polymerase sigma factor [Clostridiales bacterium]|nr:RNA polymerase sigma factor [Clostridiales bacterium]